MVGTEEEEVLMNGAACRIYCFGDYLPDVRFYNQLNPTSPLRRSMPPPTSRLAE